MSELHLARGASAPRRLFIAILTYTGTLPARVSVALIQSVQALERTGVVCDIAIEAGNCHVDDARNAMVRQFRLSNCDRMLFIDADVAWRPEELCKFVRHDADMVAGVYPKKRDGAEWPVIPCSGPRVGINGLVEVEGVPTGFLMMSRQCIERMVENCDRAYRGNADDDDMLYHILFERTWEPVEGEDYGYRWGGDFSFCRKWRALGGKIYVDPELTFDHEGQHRWTGRLADYWGGEEALQQKRLTKLLRKVRQDASDALLSDLIDAWGNAAWSATPALLRACIDACKHGQGPILECGSGLTTLVMAAACDRQIMALEHDPVWAETTARRLNAAGLGGERVRIICSPISHGWYDYIPESASMVVIDGPPRQYRRDGVIPHIERLRPDVVVVDDMDDPEQQRVSDIIGALLNATTERHGKAATLVGRRLAA